VAEGRLRVARALPPELMHWFEGHVASMDAMLARWLEAHPQAHAEAQPA
jgi:hemerythrin